MAERFQGEEARQLSVKQPETKPVKGSKRAGDRASPGWISPEGPAARDVALEVGQVNVCGSGGQGL